VSNSSVSVARSARVFLAFAIALIAATHPRSAIAQTQVSGYIVGDEVWDAAGSPYVVVGSITVSNGATLAIDDGVEVEFTSTYDLSVGQTYSYGYLDASGVTFRGNNGNVITCDEYSGGLLTNVLFDGVRVNVQSDDVTLTQSSFDAEAYLDVDAEPVITECVFQSDTPVTCPAEYPPQLASCTFAAPGSTIDISPGHILTDTQWLVMGGVDRYRLTSFVTIYNGATLTIENVEVDMWSPSGYDLTLGQTYSYGYLDASGVTFRGNNGNVITCDEYSGGLLTNVLFDGVRVNVQSDDVTLTQSSFDAEAYLDVDAEPVITECVFQSDTPVTCPAEYPPQLASCTFAAPGSTIDISPGHILTDTQWLVMGGVDRYRLTSFVTIYNGATLTIENVEVDMWSPSGYDLTLGQTYSYGYLDASGVTFRGNNGNVITCDEYSGGLLTNVLFDGVRVNVQSDDVTLTQSSFDAEAYLDVDAEPVITECVFQSDTPVTCPAEYPPQLASCTFAAPGSTIDISPGHILTDTQWLVMGGVDRYRLTSFVTIYNGATLTIENVEVDMWSPSGYDLTLGQTYSYGYLDASGVTFRGNNGNVITCDEYSGGLLTNVLFDGVRVNVQSDDVTLTQSSFDAEAYLDVDAEPVITECVFQSDTPVTCPAEYPPQLASCTFAAPGSTIDISPGHILTDTQWLVMGGVDRYRLTSFVTIYNGATLTIENVEVDMWSPSGYDLTLGQTYSYGYLDASGVTFRGNNGNVITFNEWSDGSITHCVIDGPKTAVRPTGTVIHCTTFWPPSTVQAYGDSGEMIDLTGNHWGTTNASDVESRLSHCVDNPSWPCIVFEPFLDSPPALVDFDGDCDLDVEDLMRFLPCLAGPDVVTPPPACDPEDFDLADQDADGDVDMHDFDLFQRAFTGE
jgi:hypothetical protein